jgi:hypothetical protein
MTSRASPTPPRLVLERITVIGKGWFERLDVSFSEKLTSLLGAKGTGKTTLLLFVAYVLEVDLGAKEMSTIKNNLGAGRIELVVKVAHGTRYILARSWNARTSVYNERHEPLKITVAGNDLFAVDFYSHDQVGSIADLPAEQLALLDRLAGAPMRAIEGEYAAAKKELAEREASLLAMETEKTRLDNLAARGGRDRARARSDGAEGRAAPRGGFGGARRAHPARPRAARARRIRRGDRRDALGARAARRRRAAEARVVHRRRSPRWTERRDLARDRGQAHGGRGRDRRRRHARLAAPRRRSGDVA